MAKVRGAKKSEAYRHEEEVPLRPEVGTQAQFKQKKAPKTYRYDSSLSPALDWDGQNHARELGEWLLAQIEEAAQLDPPHRFSEPRRFGHVEVTGLADAVEELKSISKPFLDWSGKAERLSFDVPTLPLFVHERLSTKAILETLKGHERDRQMELQLFADPQLPLHQQLAAYEHKGDWTNRLILGDSLVVMNSLLEYEGLGGQVQMIYIDPPYGVKFGSNFQPFVRRRDVKHNDDGDMTREPEMVKAYRDTWELGLHSYLTYLRDRLLVARELLTPTGSIFVQISEENLHHVRELLDEVLGGDNLGSVISVRKTTGEATGLLGVTTDFLLWYARDRSRCKFNPIFGPKSVAAEEKYDQVMKPDGSVRPATNEEMSGAAALASGERLLRVGDITSTRPAGEGDLREYEFKGMTFTPGTRTFATDRRGLDALARANRLHVTSPVGK